MAKFSKWGQYCIYRTWNHVFGDGLQKYYTPFLYPDILFKKKKKKHPSHLNVILQQHNAAV